MTTAYILRTAVQNVGAIILGIAKCGVMGIVFSHTIGSLCGIKRQGKKLIEKKDIICFQKTRRLIIEAKENYKQPFFSTPAIFANRFSYSSISLFIGKLYSADTLGYYSISYKALGLPLTILSNNVSKVFYKEASKEYLAKGEFKKTFFKISVILSIISALFGIFIYYLSPSIFKILLGETWIEAARYCQILVPMFCIRLVVNTVAYGFQIVGKQNLEMFYQILLVAMSILVFVIGKQMDYGIVDYLKKITISFSIIYILYYCSVMKCALGKRPSS